MKNSKKKRLRRLKRIGWVLGCSLLIPAIFILLVLYKPAESKLGKPTNDRQVSTYLTNVIYPQLYNGAQRQEPFELIVTEEGINDIISRFKWPMESDSVQYFTPKAFFKPNQIILSGIAAAKGVEFAVTIAGSPAINKNKLLNFNITTVRVGAMNMTIPAKMIASRIYTNQVTPKTIDTDDIRVKIAASLLDNKPFEPIFKIKDKKIRIEKISITNKQLTINFIPAEQGFQIYSPIKQFFRP